MSPSSYLGGCTCYVFGTGSSPLIISYNRMPMKYTVKKPTKRVSSKTHNKKLLTSFLSKKSNG